MADRESSQPSYRQYFDPQKWNIIQFDQRGCGQSTPYADLEENTTMHLVSDIEAFEITSTLTHGMFSADLGITLSLIYGISHPERVRSFILRGIFMCRKSELHWFYQDGASHVFPDAFEPYQQHIPVDEQSGLIPATTVD